MPKLPMSDSLMNLENRRAAILAQIARMGDMRAGSITLTSNSSQRRYYRLTRKVDGKTITEPFSTPAALVKAQREVAEYHRFRELSAQLLEINESICRLRSVEDLALPGARRPRRKRSAGKSSSPPPSGPRSERSEMAA